MTGRVTVEGERAREGDEADAVWGVRSSWGWRWQYLKTSFGGVLA